MSRRIVHFLVLGALLLLVDRWVLPVAGFGRGGREVIEVSASEINEIVSGWHTRTGAMPNERELAALIAAKVDEEILVRQGLALGFARTDPVIIRRLAMNMEFLGEGDGSSDISTLYQQAIALGMDRSDPVVRRRLVQRLQLLFRTVGRGPEPEPEELLAYAEAHADRYQMPRRIAFRQLFLSRDRRGDSLEADAARLGERLAREPADPDTVSNLGDASPLMQRMGPASERDIAKYFGPEFAARAMDLEAGRWHGPVPSAYGVHFVWVSEVVPEAMPPLDLIRSRVRQAIFQERDERAIREGLAKLREQYVVRVAGEPRAIAVERAFGREEAGRL